MLRLALSLLSSLQIGARLKQTFKRSLRLAAVVAVAIIILLAAAGFGLLAAYQALISLYQFNPSRPRASSPPHSQCLEFLFLPPWSCWDGNRKRAPPAG